MSEAPPHVSTDDGELLRRYCEQRSQEAFTALVERHIGLVHSAALRRVGGDAHLADDVTQNVFTDLARKASQLQGRPALAGWLYTSTRFAAAHVVRTERRRRNREQEAHAMTETADPPAPDWDNLRPIIDEAMDELNEHERDAVLLRYFANLPLAEVGARFSVSPDAARMRVDRALEKLRAALARRGLASTPSALGVALAAQSSLAAPAGYAARIVSQALGPSAASAAAPLALWKALGAAALAAAALWLLLAGDLSRPAPTAPARPALTTDRAPAEVAPPGGIMPPAPRAADPGTPPSPAVVRLSLAARQPFAAMSAMEKFILKTLWEHRKIESPTATSRWAFRKAPTTPDFAEFEQASFLLRGKNLTSVTPQGGVFLTNAGREFVAAHAGEIDAYPDAATVPLFRSRMKDDPAFRADTISRARGNLDSIYGQLFTALALPGPSLDAFKDLLVEKQLVALETNVELQKVGLPSVDNPEVYKDTAQTVQRSVNDAIRQVLTEAQFRQFEQYCISLPQWTAISQVSRKLQSTQSPLRPDQIARLLPLLEMPVTMGGAPINIAILYGSGHFSTTLANPVSDQALEKASIVLDPPQLDALRQVQEQWGRL